MRQKHEVKDGGVKEINFLVTGIGGQGALLASNVLAEVGVRADYDVKKSEIHGMSQRGGSVSTHVRWGTEVKSPVIGQGEADYLVALEKLEALRYAPMLRLGGTALIGEFEIPPLTVSSGDDLYPDDDEIKNILAQITHNIYFVSTLTLAKKVGNTRAHNVVLLGALSTLIDSVPLEAWLQVIEERVPEKYIELNRQAFEEGLQARLSQL